MDGRNATTLSAADAAAARNLEETAKIQAEAARSTEEATERATAAEKAASAAAAAAEDFKKRTQKAGARRPLTPQVNRVGLD